MKSHLFAAPVILLCLAPSALEVRADQKSASGEKTLKAAYFVSGLHCPPCTQTVETSLKKVKGVRSIKVDWKSKLAQIEVDEALLPAQKVGHVIADTPHMMGDNMHYGGWLMLKVQDLKDEATAKTVKAIASKVDGVSRIIAFPAQRSIGIQFASKGALTSQQLIDRLKQAGIQATPY